MRREEYRETRKREIMEACFACYCRVGLGGMGIKELTKECGMSPGNLYTYFKSIEDLVIQSTAHCMAKVEDDFMAKAPEDAKDMPLFLDEVPYWTAKEHGAKYRLMYQVYTHPKYIEHGKRFFKGVTERYSEYAKRLEPTLGIPKEIITPLIFVFVRAAVHYALFEDECYLRAQIGLLKQSVALFAEKFHEEKEAGEKDEGRSANDSPANVCYRFVGVTKSQTAEDKSAATAYGRHREDTI